jgi:hypothetical protein
MLPARGAAVGDADGAGDGTGDGKICAAAGTREAGAAAAATTVAIRTRCTRIVCALIFLQDGDAVDHEFAV